MTDQLITVLTFTHPNDLIFIRGRLEAEGIECFVQGELTSQIRPFMSNAFGGIELQVKENDLEKAVEILKEYGYVQDSDLQAPTGMFTSFDKTTAKFPLISKLPFWLRLLLVVLVLTALLMGFIYCMVWLTLNG